MSVVKETQDLRKLLEKWAANPDWPLLRRYDLLREKTPESQVDRLYHSVKNGLARFGFVSPHVTKYSWLSTLKHAEPKAKTSTTLLIWALGVEKSDLRKACENFLQRFDAGSTIVPVLVTDVPDFHYFSRLKWLVEYVPELGGEGTSYRERKQYYLAWRYRDALVVPVSAGRASDAEWNEIMEMKF